MQRYGLAVAVLCLAALPLLTTTPNEAQASPLEHAHTLTLPDGRALGWAEYGQPGGEPVFFFHGGNDSRLEASLLEAAASDAGVWLIAPDRPGYGMSDPLPDRTIAGWADDVSALADHLEISSFSVVGHSGGGPHALSVAAGMPERVTRAAIFAGAAPREAPIDGMAIPFRLNRWLTIHAPSLQRRLMASHCSGLSDPETFLRRWGSASPADAALFAAQPDVGLAVVADMVEGCRQGSAAAAQESRLYYSDWNLALADIVAPVELYYGDADPQAPLGWGEHLAARIPTATLHVLRGEGHMSVLVHHGARALQP